MTSQWFESYFNEDYYRADRHEDTDLEVEGISLLLGPPKDTTVLDLGCGYGRHSLKLSELGYRMVGYDLSPILLRRAAGGNPNIGWIRGDVRSLPFRNKFDGMISMFNAFGYFEDETDNYIVLQEVEAVLRPGGRLIVQLVNRDFLVRKFVEEEIRREDGLLVLEERAFDAVSSRVLTVTTVIEGTEQRRYESSIRVYTLSELDMLMSAAGLKIREVYGGLDQRLFDWDTNQLIIIAEKP
ncbi:MAG: class I SAM-dependent methyltransferase [Gemmatimonadota bacterium]|nr:class I SAM-dependent methyltransferase [Gemmatimonadota bacterium]